MRGVDASHHQGSPNWTAARAGGYEFAILKATDRKPYAFVNWFHQELPRAKASGMVCGAYHFLRAGDGVGQARYFVDEVTKEPGGFSGLLAAVDCESHPDGTFPSFDTIKAFVIEFKRLVPSHPLLCYTGHAFWTGNLGNPQGVAIGPLWHAEYEPSAAEVADGPEKGVYGGWAGPTIWQFTSNLGQIGMGNVPGFSGAVDANLFDGDRNDLLQYTVSVEDDMTPEEHQLLVDSEARSEAILKLVRDQIDPHVDTLLARPTPLTPAQTKTAVDAPTAAEIATAVVAALPPSAGGDAPTIEEITEAVRGVVNGTTLTA